jgi:hypothetical protein
MAAAGTGTVVLGRALSGQGVDPLSAAAGIALLGLTWLILGTYRDLLRE